MSEARIMGNGATYALAAFVRDALAFLEHNPLVFITVVVVVAVIFQMTRPRVR